jgi:hypothetical protein
VSRFATKEQSLAGFGEVYKGMADCLEARKDGG